MLTQNERAALQTIDNLIFDLGFLCDTVSISTDVDIEPEPQDIIDLATAVLAVRSQLVRIRNKKVRMLFLPFESRDIKKVFNVHLFHVSEEIHDPAKLRRAVRNVNTFTDYITAALAAVGTTYKSYLK